MIVVLKGKKTKLPRVFIVNAADIACYIIGGILFGLAIAILAGAFT